MQPLDFSRRGKNSRTVLTAEKKFRLKTFSKFSLLGIGSKTLLPLPTLHIKMFKKSNSSSIKFLKLDIDSFFVKSHSFKILFSLFSKGKIHFSKESRLLAV